MAFPATASPAVPGDSLRLGVSPESSPKRGIALRTNLAYAASATPNIGLEVPFSNHFSIGFNAGLKPWPRWFVWDWDKTVEKKWKHLLVAPELRFWPRAVYDGLFIGTDLSF